MKNGQSVIRRTRKRKPGDGPSEIARNSARRKKVEGGGKQTSFPATGSANDVHEYFAGLPGAGQKRLQEMRALIRAAVPADALEVISYGIPAFKLRKVVVWYAAFAEHCSLFPTAAIIEKFRDELKGFTISKGTVQFPIGKSLPGGLIRKLVKARVAQSQRAK